MPLESIITAGNRAWKSAFSSRKRPLPSHRKPRLTQPQPKLITYKGNVYVRRLKQRGRAARNKTSLNIIPKLRLANPAPTPKPLTNPTSPNASVLPTTISETTTLVGEGALSSAGTANSKTSAFYRWLLEWLKQNGPVLILNFGSICTLVGFTRQDILELRMLSMTGSITFCIYQSFQSPLKWTPIAWSTLFAGVNGFKIMRILNERTSSVVLTEKDEVVFVEHFMTHGVTPKQFETLFKKGKPELYKKGELIVRQGQPLNRLYLVIEGNTRASILGRRLTAISSHPGNWRRMGGDSGAWIGEMEFLRRFGLKDAEQMEKIRLLQSKTAENGIHNQHQNHHHVSPNDSNIQRSETPGRALYTIVTETDTHVISWSYDDVESLMKNSTDFRGAMTRAMTAHVIGKVINFSVSRSAGRPSWTAWLDDWRFSGARVTTTHNHLPEEDPHKLPVDDHEEEVDDDDEDDFNFEDDDDEDTELGALMNMLPIPSRR